MRSAARPTVLLLASALAGCNGDDSAPAEPVRPLAPAAPRAPLPAFPVPGAGREDEEARWARAREEMVERHLKAIGVEDPDVLRSMGRVPRHLFVAEGQRNRAYEDTPLPIGHGQTISAPDVVGYMTQALRVKAGAKVLDVGTGSGYQAAVLADLGCRVFSIEILEPLADEARKRLADLKYARVTVRTGDGYLGWPEEAPFDGILVAAAPDHVPKPLVEQLKPGARLVIPVGPVGGVQSLLVLTKQEDGTVDEEETLAVRFVPLVR